MQSFWMRKDSIRRDPSCSVFFLKPDIPAGTVLASLHPPCTVLLYRVCYCYQARLRRQFVSELQRTGLGVPGGRQAVAGRSPNDISLRERVLHRHVGSFIPSDAYSATDRSCISYLADIVMEEKVKATRGNAL